MDWLVTHCLNQTQNCTDIARSQITATGAFPSGDDPSLDTSAGSATATTGQQSGAATGTAGSGQPSVRAGCPRSSFESRRALRKCRQAIGEAVVHVQQAGGP